MGSVARDGRIKVVVPVLEDCPLFELAVPCGVFGPDRRDLSPRWYELTACQTGPQAHHASGGLVLQAPQGLEAVAEADLVVVPACVVPSYRPPAELLDALRAAHERGARVAALCSGAFILAAAGLLDGRAATTHWMYADELRRRHPRVRVDEHPLYIDEGDVLTSAGTAASLDLCLHIVRSDFGAAAAADVSRRMVIAPHREGGQAQYIPPGSGPVREDGLAPVLDWARQRLHRPLTIAQLAERAGMSNRTFGRRFAEQVGTTPLKWVNRQRLARARELLETTDLTIDVVAERSGLGTASGLRQYFQRELATTPASYRRTFRRQAR
ncbi:helix-turn-helix domain-containing protein [Saccharopolyspora sp. K220]|uniref:GlxA family transcriptional regulator n=1 Tax=Saccharopolyspora soli TaxID=2926618 RepID=UPI001F56749F|nr:helix-turn-helix domain-containing protein [Saccharopolyspora soli]MCI2422087.1 helix-turn-helix domain-containing protein [Saccharopolyspora soli]